MERDDALDDREPESEPALGAVERLALLFEHLQIGYDLREAYRIAIDLQLRREHELHGVLAFLEERPAISIACCTMFPSASRSTWSSTFPRAIRDTSSKSSTKRTTWRTWRSMTGRS